MTQAKRTVFLTGVLLGMLVGLLLIPSASRSTIATIAVALAALIILIEISARLGTRNDVLIGAQITQAFITSVAIVLAGYFYFLERRGQPHADVSQIVQAIQLPDDNVALEVSITIKNLGSQLLTINHLRSSLQIVDLQRIGLSSLPRTPSPYWTAIDTINGQTAPAFQEAEFQWPTLRFYDGPVHHEIEPGESDLITVTFLMPCQQARFARIATGVTKVAEKAPKQISRDRTSKQKPEDNESGMVWKARSFVDLEPICKRRG